MKNLRWWNLHLPAALVCMFALAAVERTSAQQPTTPSVVEMAPEVRSIPEIKPLSPQQQFELRPMPAANCRWQPTYRCFFECYSCKAPPCAPLCNYQQCCDNYCAKPLPCPPNPCLKWCCDTFCPKPPVCSFPGAPCPPCNTSFR